jgi:hypothetical protein
MLLPLVLLPVPQLLCFVSTAAGSVLSTWSPADQRMQHARLALHPLLRSEGTSAYSSAIEHHAVPRPDWLYRLHAAAQHCNAALLTGLSIRHLPETDGLSCSTDVMISDQYQLQLPCHAPARSFRNECHDT